MELLAEVKAYLDITWDDKPTNIKLQGMIDRSIYRLNDLLGAEIDFKEDLTAKELLLNRVMYERSAALDDFEKNYQSEIIFLQNKYRVKGLNVTVEK